jgi:hypothetical protein
VAVPCPRCGRPYDEGLFAGGRTLWCTCGARVGAARAAEGAARGAQTRFIADAMLGRLARWLRLLGVDCAYEREIEDAELVRRASAEERVILSRDRALPEEWRVRGIHPVDSEDLTEQLREIVRAFDLAGAVRPFTRCTECNRPLRAAAKGDVAQRVPARVLRDHERFLECPGCGRVYWEGSHAERIRRRLAEVLAGLDA